MKPEAEMSVTHPVSEELRQQMIDRFWETIPPMWNRIRGRLRATATEEFEITVEQFHILRHIRKGFCSVGELAKAKQISRPAVSQAVDVLVEKGLVTRQQSASDRRFVRLQLTPAGDELLNAVFQNSREWMMEKLVLLDAQDIHILLDAMDIFQRTFGDPDPSIPAKSMPR